MLSTLLFYMQLLYMDAVLLYIYQWFLYVWWYYQGKFKGSDAGEIIQWDGHSLTRPRMEGDKMEWVEAVPVGVHLLTCVCDQPRIVCGYWEPLMTCLR